MAKGKGEIKGWITRNGVHIPIYGHYSVRGGEEPQSRGARWKRKKELSPRQVRQATTYLSTSNKESIKAVKAELNKMDDSKEVFSGVTVKDLKEHFAGVDENTTLGEYRKQLFDKDDQDNPIKEGKKEVFKKATKEVESTPEGQKRKETVGAIHEKDEKLAKGMKEVDKDDKYANRDWNKDVDDAKHYGYSEQSEEGKKPVTKAEEEKQAKQSFRDKKAQEQGFADDASMRSYNEETGVNKETWKEEGKTIEVNGRKINVKPGENNSQAIYRQAMEEQGKPVDKQFYNELVADSKQESSKYHDKMSTPYKDLNDKQKAFVKELAEERAGHPLTDKGVQFYQDLENDERAMRQAEIAKRKPMREIPKQESSTPDFSKMSYSEAGQYVAEHKKDFGLSEGADAYQAAYDIKRRASYKDANSKIANGEHTVDIKTDGSARQINNAKKAIRKASNKAGENYGISEHKGTVTGSRLLEGGATFDTAVRNMSVSGLKQAYNTATGTERAQIRARLQALGYQFRGGKWTKK